MKKLGLVSLAAAVALSTSAMADVKYSGKLYIEQQVKQTETAGAGGGSSEYYEIDLDLTATKKINDNFSATVTVQADKENGTGNDGAMENVATGNQNVDIEQATFTYNTGALSVTTGLQAISTPNTDGENGAGVFATYGLGNVTLAGAYYISNDLPSLLGGAAVLKDEYVGALAALGSIGAVNFQAWHIAVSNIATMNTLIVGGKIGPVALEARQATTSYDPSGLKDGSTMKIAASGKLSNGIALRATYLANDEDGATVTTDNSSSNTIELVTLGASNSADTTVTHIGATFPVAGTSLAIDHAMAEIKDDDHTETVVKVSKGLAKGLSGSLRYAIYNDDAADKDVTHARYDLTYKF